MQRRESDPGAPRYDEMRGMTSEQMRHVVIAKDLVEERRFRQRYGFWALFGPLVRSGFLGLVALVRLPWRALRRN
jgi:hypothetical protein